jgi:hypothetical protein
MGDVLEVHEIRGRPPVLRNAHRVTLGLNLGNDLSDLALEVGHKHWRSFLHGSKTSWKCRLLKIFQQSIKPPLTL